MLVCFSSYSRKIIFIFVNAIFFIKIVSAMVSFWWYIYNYFNFLSYFPFRILTIFECHCKVMHDKTKPLPQILSSYPRGSKELRGLYTKRFTPDDAYDWFTSRGVRLKTESDGRMFPTTDNSQTIIDTITNAALSAGVKIRTKEKVNSVHLIGESGCRENGKFLVNTSSKLQQSATEEDFDAIILATGSFPHGHEIARSLGHTIVKAVPSLFTFDAKELVKDGGPFNGLAGVSVPLARMTLKVTDKMTSSPDLSSDPVKEEPSTGKNAKKKRRKKATTIIQEGPLLITHHGVSGPATLRLSAFAAREFHAMNYRSIVNIHFCPQWEEEQKQLNGGNRGNSEGILMDYLWEMTRKLPNRQISTSSPLLMKSTGNDDHASVGSSTMPNNMPIIPKRLWSALVQHSGIPLNTTWGDASKSMIRSLSNNVSSFPLTVTSKGVFKEEFVTAGGVTLKEVQMTNMESKVVPGLFFCGEVLDVDGVTGGFNFMGCWSTGFIAGEGAALACCSKVATN